MLAIGDALPNLDCVTQIEESCFAQLLGGGTGILFSFPGMVRGVGGRGVGGKGEPPTICINVY